MTDREMWVTANTDKSDPKGHWFFQPGGMLGDQHGVRRLLFTITNGEPGFELFLEPTCGNLKCVAPSHQRPKTRKEVFGGRKAKP